MLASGMTIPFSDRLVGEAPFSQAQSKAKNADNAMNVRCMFHLLSGHCVRDGVGVSCGRAFVEGADTKNDPMGIGPFLFPPLGFLHAADERLEVGGFGEVDGDGMVSGLAHDLEHLQDDTGLH